MSETPWAHLPNAKHIDAVLADVRKRPEAWRRSLRDLASCMREKAFDAVRNFHPHTEGMDILWSHVCASAERASNDIQVRGAAWDAATDTLCALVFLNSSADLLDCTPDVLRAMIDLAEPPVCHQAALLLPYAIVRSNAKQEVT